MMIEVLLNIITMTVAYCFRADCNCHSNVFVVHVGKSTQELYVTSVVCPELCLLQVKMKGTKAESRVTFFCTGVYKEYFLSLGCLTYIYYIIIISLVSFLKTNTNMLVETIMLSDHNWRYSVTTSRSNLLCTVLSATYILHQTISSSSSTCNSPTY